MEQPTEKERRKDAKKRNSENGILLNRTRKICKILGWKIEIENQIMGKITITFMKATNKND